MISKIFIGALTDKLYAFSGRMWELNVNNTIDIYDSLGSNIKIYISGAERFFNEVKAQQLVGGIQNKIVVTQGAKVRDAVATYHIAHPPRAARHHGV